MPTKLCLIYTQLGHLFIGIRSLNLFYKGQWSPLRILSRIVYQWLNKHLHTMAEILLIQSQMRFESIFDRADYFFNYIQRLGVLGYKGR